MKQLIKDVFSLWVTLFVCILIVFAVEQVWVVVTGDGGCLTKVLTYDCKEVCCER